MAREKYTAEQMIDALVATKGMITLAARQLGCAPNTVRRYIREYVTVREAQFEATEQMGDAVELALYDEAINKRNTAALIFLAKTKFKARGYVERQEVSGKDGGAIEVSDGLSDADRMARIAAIFDAARARTT